MTKNQIEYAKLLETSRANVAQETLTSSRDERQYSLGLGNLAETGRANLEREKLQAANLSELGRSNRARESEQARSNFAREVEARRSNLTNEELTRVRNQQDFDVRNRSLAETARFNTVSLSNEAKRLDLDLQRNRETHRSNVASESIASRRAAEDARANRANETIKRNQTAFDYYATNANVSQRDRAIAQSDRELRERNRSNIEREAETRRHNMRAEDETARMNRAQEQTAKRGQNFGLAGSALNSGVRLAEGLLRNNR